MAPTVYRMMHSDYMKLPEEGMCIDFGWASSIEDGIEVGSDVYYPHYRDNGRRARAAIVTVQQMSDYRWREEFNPDCYLDERVVDELQHQILVDPETPPEIVNLVWKGNDRDAAEWRYDVWRSVRGVLWVCLERVGICPCCLFNSVR